MLAGKKIKITILKCFDPKEVFDTLPVTLPSEPKPCEYFEEGQEMIIGEDLKMPDNFCNVAWHTIFPSIRTLSFGGNLPWFKEQGVACPERLFACPGPNEISGYWGCFAIPYSKICLHNAVPAWYSQGRHSNRRSMFFGRVTNRILRVGR